MVIVCARNEIKMSGFKTLLDLLHNFILPAYDKTVEKNEITV